MRGKMLLRVLLRPKVLLILAISLMLESLWHVYNHGSTDPITQAQAPDRLFQKGCRIPNETSERANATVLMLARNEDIEDALQAVRSFESHFNRWFKYPILFLNDQLWDESFIAALSANVTSGDVSFDTIPEAMWSFPSWMDPRLARARMRKQEVEGVFHGGSESYHHMCRFYSGFFYDHSALRKYRWFWRLEPDARYTCAITYDPFRAMEDRGKKYGYTMALWEIGKTAPSLFRLASEFKDQYRVQTKGLWRAMSDASWLPWPVRGAARWVLPHRNKEGEVWNMCHFWSNFEIADLEFFRSKAYREFFAFLDRSGGFYNERFGDAAVHSLAAALLLEPRELHHFEDFGYKHSNLWAQPHNAQGQQLRGEDLSEESWAEEREGGVGCRCEVQDERVMNFPDTCLRRVKEAGISSWN